MRVRKTSDVLSSADIYRAFSCVSLKLERTVMLLISSTMKIPPQIKLPYKFIGCVPIQHHCHQLFTCLTKTNKYEDKKPDSNYSLMKHSQEFASKRYFHKLDAFLQWDLKKNASNLTSLYNFKARKYTGQQYLI